tara:strand:+ start:230 stop:469 length:240 start_codon:yes stop_codon:yes gene_type:complete
LVEEAAGGAELVNGQVAVAQVLELYDLVAVGADRAGVEPLLLGISGSALLNDTDQAVQESDGVVDVWHLISFLVGDEKL